MTRIGVMKHLRVLEEAGLLTTKRRGREKLHFPNPVPIRLVHDRWVSKYAEPWAATLTGLKKRLEETMEKVFEIYIKTTPERLWEAITDPELRSQYSFGVGVSSTGSPARYEAAHAAAGVAIAEGENLEVAPPHRLVQSFNALWSDEVKAEGTSRHLGDRAGRGLLPADRHPRPAPRGRERRALRRLADDSLRPEDAAGDGRATHDAGLAHVRRRDVGLLMSDRGAVAFRRRLDPHPWRLPCARLRARLGTPPAPAGATAFRAGGPTTASRCSSSSRAGSGSCTSASSTSTAWRPRSAGTWLHARLAESASALVGLDVEEEGVRWAADHGFEAYAVDAQSPEAVEALGIEPADVVIAGEVVEHLDAPGPFFRSLRQLARPDGLLVVTTRTPTGC